MSKCNALNSQQNHKPQALQFKVQGECNQRPQISPWKHLPLQNYYQDLPSILLINESKHVGYYSFVDK